MCFIHYSHLEQQLRTGGTGEHFQIIISFFFFPKGLTGRVERFSAAGA